MQILDLRVDSEPTFSEIFKQVKFMLHAGMELLQATLCLVLHESCDFTFGHIELVGGDDFRHALDQRMQLRINSIIKVSKDGTSQDNKESCESNRCWVSGTNFGTSAQMPQFCVDQVDFEILTDELGNRIHI